VIKLCLYFYATPALRLEICCRDFILSLHPSLSFQILLSTYWTLTLGHD
jgi:hypothetical protein